MAPLLNLSLRQMAGRKRLIIIFILVALPIGLAILLSQLLGDQSNFEREFGDTIIDGLFLGVIVPIVVMTLATGAFGNEMEDRTLNVIYLKPIPRYAIVLPKYLASVIVAGGILIAATAVITAVAYGSAGAIIAGVVAVTVGVVTYAAIFTWAGLITNRALGLALVYVFLWEQFLTRVIRGVRYFSVREYSLSILQGLDGDSFAVFANRVLDWPAALAAAGVVTVLFVGLTIRRLQRMDVP